MYGRRHRTGRKEGIAQLEEGVGAPPKASVEPRAEGAEPTQIVPPCAFAPTVAVGDRTHVRSSFWGRAQQVDGEQGEPAEADSDRDAL